MCEEMEKMMAAQMKQMEQQMAEAKKQQQQMVAEVRAATAPALRALKRSETFKELSSETSKDPRVEMVPKVPKVHRASKASVVVPIRPRKYLLRSFRWMVPTQV